MLETFIAVTAIIAVSFLFLAVRLLFGKNFVNTHIEGNPAMAQRGIHCVSHQDRTARRQRNKVKENLRTNRT